MWQQQQGRQQSPASPVTTMSEPVCEYVPGTSLLSSFSAVVCGYVILKACDSSSRNDGRALHHQQQHFQDFMLDAQRHCCCPASQESTAGASWERSAVASQQGGTALHLQQHACQICCAGHTKDPVAVQLLGINSTKEDMQPCSMRSNLVKTWLLDTQSRLVPVAASWG